MKQTIRSYISFTRTERIGIIALSVLLVLLITMRATMHLWVQPATDTEKEKKLVAAWEAFKDAHTTGETPRTASKEHQDQHDENTTAMPDTLDLNTADSATLVRLRGIGPVTAGKIVQWRRKHGAFSHIGQLRETGSFSAATFEIISRHLKISPVKHD